MFCVVDYRIYQSLRAIANNAVARIVSDSYVAIRYLLPVDSGGLRRDKTVILSKYGQSGTVYICQLSFYLKVMNSYF